MNCFGKFARIVSIRASLAKTGAWQWFEIKPPNTDAVEQIREARRFTENFMGLSSVSLVFLCDLCVKLLGLAVPQCADHCPGFRCALARLR